MIRQVATAAIVATLASALLTAGATSAGADRHHGSTNGPCNYTTTPPICGRFFATMARR